MTEDDIVRYVEGLAGTHVWIASEADGSPELAWGDSFFFYDPDAAGTAQKMPFATIVTKDYEGFEKGSDLAEPGAFRLNVAVGRNRFTELVGHSPAEHAEHHDIFDYTVRDRVIPHPAYYSQAWLSIVNPGAATGELARTLVGEAHALAANRHRRRHG